ncbi:hypothetical protein H0H81_007048 [Sphagnurus paluster]|uniref:Uncharacterized protein n=1 Tax=Sphagnurus paluster TaxID=117069 RepID=A0A9P7GKW0_9AGAR|nr:hypothetical protein H0H81_007048 [Sphagnurus paluster]
MQPLSHDPQVYSQPVSKYPNPAGSPRLVLARSTLETLLALVASALMFDFSTLFGILSVLAPIYKRIARASIPELGDHFRSAIQAESHDSKITVPTCVHEILAPSLEGDDDDDGESSSSTVTLVSDGLVQTSPEEGANHDKPFPSLSPASLFKQTPNAREAADSSFSGSVGNRTVTRSGEQLPIYDQVEKSGTSFPHSSATVHIADQTAAGAALDGLASDSIPTAESSTTNETDETDGFQDDVSFIVSDDSPPPVRDEEEQMLWEYTFHDWAFDVRAALDAEETKSEPEAKLDVTPHEEAPPLGLRQRKVLTTDDQPPRGSWYEMVVAQGLEHEPLETQVELLDYGRDLDAEGPPAIWNPDEYWDGVDLELEEEQGLDEITKLHDSATGLPSLSDIAPPKPKAATRSSLRSFLSVVSRKAVRRGSQH